MLRALFLSHLQACTFVYRQCIDRLQCAVLYWQHRYSWKESDMSDQLLKHANPLMSQQRTTWGFYPGKHEGAGGDFGDVDVFCTHHLIGIGWPATKNLQTFVTEKRPSSDLAVCVREAYQNERDIATWSAEKRDRWFRDSAGVLHRFLCEAQPGDSVIYACKWDKQVYVGRIKDTEAGRYKYVAPEEEQLHWHCRHFRAVEWLKQVPYELCSKQELAQVRTQSKFWRMKACPEKFSFL